MKRTLRIFIALALCLFTILPTIASAKTYSPTDTDVSIQLDDSIWDVLTRDNADDPLYAVLFGMSNEELYQSLCDDGIYLNAFPLHADDNDLELLIFKIENASPQIANMSTHSDEDILSGTYSYGIDNQVDFSLYKNEYKFLQCETSSTSADGQAIYIHDYITLINYDNYTFKFWSYQPFTDEDRNEMNTIMDTVVFDVDPDAKDIVPANVRTIPSKKEQAKTIFINAIMETMMHIIAVGIVFAVIRYIKRKKMEKQKPPINLDDPDTNYDSMDKAPDD